jgi:cell wall-associated NlpC family hydrolase
MAALVTPSAAMAQVSDGAPKPFEAFSNSAHSLRDSLVILARAQLGKKYKRGGQSPTGFDCSGLVKYILTALNLDVPRTARQLAAVGAPVGRDTSRLLPGDLLTFSKTKQGRISHVGIYVGDGKFIHASITTGRVIETTIDRKGSPLTRMWRGARRVSFVDDSASAPVVALTDETAPKPAVGSTPQP